MRILTLVGAAAAVTLSLAGCSDGDDPPGGGPSPPATTPATSAPASPTPTAPPTLPASATPDARGAEIFVRHFWSVFNYTYATNDTRPLTSISTPTCGFCADVAKDVDGLARDGARTEGGLAHVAEAIAAPDDPRTGVAVAAVVSQDPAVTVDAQGSRAESPGVPRRAVTLLAILGADGWRMAGVQIEQAP